MLAILVLCSSTLLPPLDLAQAQAAWATRRTSTPRMVIKSQPGRGSEMRRPITCFLLTSYDDANAMTRNHRTLLRKDHDTKLMSLRRDTDKRDMGWRFHLFSSHGMDRTKILPYYLHGHALLQLLVQLILFYGDGLGEHAAWRKKAS